MQVFVSFPDAGYPDIVFEAGAKSLVADAAQAAADEWGADAEFLELSFCGSVIPSSSLLMSHGVEAGSQLAASLLQVFGRSWVTNDGKRKKLMQHLSKIGERHLFLDTPTFATDGCFRLDMVWIPRAIEEVSFINPHPSITSAEFRTPAYGQHFPVSKVNLTGLKSITTIGGYFLASCSSLTSIDLKAINNVKRLGMGFLSCCSSLTTLDLKFNDVTTIDPGFLHDCSSLTSLDLVGLNSVTKIEVGFLSRCSSLTSLDLKGLNNVTAIGNGFLHTCSSLTSIDLKALSNVTAIGDGFMHSCFSITSLDLMGLNNVTTIGNGFLHSCSSLASLSLMGLNNVKTIGTNFLFSSSLTSLDMNGLDNVTEIGAHFLMDCSSLTRNKIIPPIPASKAGPEVTKRLKEAGF